MNLMHKIYYTYFTGIPKNTKDNKITATIITYHTEDHMNNWTTVYAFIRDNRYNCALLTQGKTLKITCTTVTSIP